MGHRICNRHHHDPDNLSGDENNRCVGKSNEPGFMKNNHLLILSLSLVYLFLIGPLVIIVFSAFNDSEFLDFPPQTYSLRWFYRIFESEMFISAFQNSLLLSFFGALGALLIGLPAAYSLSRLRFWGSGVLATGIFLTYLVPDTLLFIPLFKIVGWLGLLNSYWVLVLVYPTLSVPFCTWLMIGYFSSIPKEIDEAALIDGANHMQMLLKVFIPVAMPGLIAATIFAFTVSWAGFLYPLAFIYSESEMVLTVGTVTTLIKGDVFHWGGLMAGALLAAAPPVIVYAFLMDYYIAGLTSGATKG